MLDGENKLLYAKHLPIVTGDGNKTIRQLLFEFNYDYFIDKLEDSKYDKLLADRLIKLAKQVCEEINLKFGSIDIIQTTDNDLLVLEANSGVMLENYIRQNPDEYVTAKNIYRNAIEDLFKS